MTEQELDKELAKLLARVRKHRAKRAIYVFILKVNKYLVMTWSSITWDYSLSISHNQLVYDVINNLNMERARIIKEAEWIKEHLGK